MHQSGKATRPASAGTDEMSEDSRRVRIPWFPVYAEVRHLLRIWPGRPKSHITGLHSALARIRGTPRNPVNWTDPAAWIPDKLRGDDDSRELAHAIWSESGGAVNPRYTTSHWLLSQNYELLEEGADGRLLLTDRGRDFIDHELGEVESFLDGREGLIELLGIVAHSGPAPIRDLVEPWSEYVTRISNFRSDSTIRDTLRRRLNNLLHRDLVTRERAKYAVTDTGRAYLGRVGPTPPGPDELHAIRELARTCESSVRESLREHLLKMAPEAFEGLVARLLEEMDYQDVKVVGGSGDGGVDVKAEIKLGVTSVLEVVQAKRHRRTVQRKDLDALRGSLYRFNAVRGTIVATSRFAKGAIEAAFAPGVAPITLIDGDTLIDLLIKHGIGVRKRKIEILTIDPEGLSAVENPEAG